MADLPLSPVATVQRSFNAAEHDARNKVFRALERNPTKQLDDSSLPVLVDQLGVSESELLELRAAFNKFDDDRSCLLDLQELANLLKDIGASQSKDEIERLCRRIDKDANGEVDFIEFLHMMSVMPGYREMVLQHHVTKLETLVDHMETDRLSRKDGEEQDEKKLPIHAIKHSLRKEMSEAASCMELPFTASLFFIYTIGVMLHQKYWILNSLDYAIIFDIEENANFAFSGIVPMENGRMGHKIYTDVNNIPDFWSWLGMGLVPMLWIEVWDVSEPRANVLSMCASARANLEGWGYDPRDVEKTEWAAIFEKCPDVDPQALPSEYYGKNPFGMYLYFNRLLGGVRLRAESREQQPCTGPSGLVKAAFDAPCFDSAYGLQPDLNDGLKINEDYINKPGAPTEILRAGLSQQAIRKELLRLEKENWLNPSVQKVELSFVTYNGHVDTVTITYINFFFNRAGHIMKQLESMSLWLHPYHEASYLYVIDSVWVLMLAKILIAELLEIRSYLSKHGFVRGLKKYIGFWNAIDWISVSSAIQLLIRWIRQMVKIQKVAEFMEGGDLSIPGSWAEKEDMLEFHSCVEEAALSSIMVRRLLAFYLMVISARCFKAFHAQPRLAMVTKTLSQAAMDILHFGVVLLAVFMSFVASGIMLFGEELPEFSHFNRAINTCWRLILGDFDWEGLHSAATRVVAGVWFVFFSILVVQIMLNMLLAVIMDVYTQVKSQTSDAKTLPAQALEIWRGYKALLRGEQLRLHTILKALSSDDDEDDAEYEERVVDAQALQMMVSGLRKEQAVEILSRTHATLDDNSAKDMSISGAMDKVCTLYEREEKCHYCIEQLMFLCSMIADKVAMLSRPPMGSAMSRQVSPTSPAISRQVSTTCNAGGGDSAAGSCPGVEEILPPPKLPHVLAEALERAALGKLENRLRSLTVGREQMLHQAESTAKSVETRLSNLDRQVAALIQETGSIAKGTAHENERAPLKQGRVTEMNPCCISFKSSNPSAIRQ